MSLKTLLTLVAGGICGIALVISCSDDSPGKADAAEQVCDCPAAEPPLAGRFYTRENTATLAPNARGGQSGACRPGDQLTGGSCTSVASGAPDIYLVESGAKELPANPAWGCEFKNNTVSSVDIKVIAFCLDVTP